MQTAIVNKIIPFSSVDGPGNRTAVFLQGCGFSCAYCHNPETINTCINCGTCVDYCKTNALNFRNGKVSYDLSKCVMCDECIHNCPNMSSPKTMHMTSEQVLNEVKRHMPFVRGITVSGGECTRQRDFLLELFTMAHECGLHTLIDSNGSYDFSKDSELMAVTDGVMLDVKAYSEEEHLRLTGMSNAMVLCNLDYLLKVNKLEEVRTVIVPKMINCEETVSFVARKLVTSDKQNIRYKIIKYRVNGVRAEYKNIIPPTDEYLQSLKDLAMDLGLTNVYIT